jgi:hypothetical protein
VVLCPICWWVMAIFPSGVVSYMLWVMAMVPSGVVSYMLVGDGHVS